VPYGDRWATRREGAERVSRTFDTQREAQNSARETAKREHVEVVIRRRDGTIRLLRDGFAAGSSFRPFPLHEPARAGSQHVV
jgi:Uncharacterized protein conserved in bacteria (DUF2188)